jgi:hypothetical protein
MNAKIAIVLLCAGGRFCRRKLEKQAPDSVESEKSFACLCWPSLKNRAFDDIEYTAGGTEWKQELLEQKKNELHIEQRK